MIIAVDYDGTLIEDTPSGRIPKLRLGAERALRACVDNGHSLVLHSVRCQLGIFDRSILHAVSTGAACEFLESHADAARFVEMRSFLRARKLWHRCEGGVFDTIWVLPGKPFADEYLDDRSRRMASSRAWREVAWELGGVDDGQRRTVRPLRRP